VTVHLKKVLLRKLKLRQLEKLRADQPNDTETITT
jgi:hypothetical protein